VVITKADAQLRIAKGPAIARSGVDVSPLNDLLETEGISMKPLFGSEERILGRTASLMKETGEAIPDLSVYYHVEASDERLDELAERFRQLDVVEAAYVTPPGELPLWIDVEREVPMETNLGEPTAKTPNFTPRQVYLGPAPAGIDANYAWTLGGGRGAGVRVMDCEWGWNFTHEGLLQNSLGILVGTGTSDLHSENHGTAVVGVIGADDNAFGVTGIAPEAQVGAAAFSKPYAQVIMEAADKLGAGDIILLEIHLPGPRFNFQSRPDQRGYIAIEWWPHLFAAIRYAVSKGVIVVEAAGNGAENLDDPIYNTRPAVFPTSWTNPFNPANPSSDAVLVGAGAPPQGTHGRDHGPDRSRLDFSNYGARVDCQGWGREVTSTGGYYDQPGDLQDGSNKNLWYTDQFSGTSSASPVIVGALACAQGVLRGQGGTLLNSATARNVLQITGSPQQDAPGRPATQRIGNRPNLAQLITAVADVWQNDKTVIRTHAKVGSQMAWALLSGSNWLSVRPSSPDGVSNVFQILCEALAKNRKVDVYIRHGQIEQATLK
jgi:hypothetical protein